MPLMIAAVGVLSVYLIYINLRFFIKRRSMIKRLGRLCAEKGYLIQKEKCRISILRGGEELTLFIIGTRFRRARLAFIDGGAYRFEYTYSIPLRFEQSAVFPFCSRKREIMPCADIILLCPVCREAVVRFHDGREESLGDGDAVGGAHLYSLSGLLSFL